MSAATTHAALAASDSALHAARAEASVLKRRLRQYATTLDAVSARAREEVAIALAARNEARSLANRAELEKDGVVAELQGLKAALDASRKRHEDIVSKHVSERDRAAVIDEEARGLRADNERLRKMVAEFEFRKSENDEEIAAKEAELYRVNEVLRSVSEQKNFMKDENNTIMSELGATKRELAIVRHQLNTMAPPEISQNVRRDIAEGAADAVERRTLKMLRAIARHYLKFKLEIKEETPNVKSSENNERDQAEARVFAFASAAQDVISGQTDLDPDQDSLGDVRDAEEILQEHLAFIKRMSAVTEPEAGNVREAVARLDEEDKEPELVRSEVEEEDDTQNDGEEMTTPDDVLTEETQSKESPTDEKSSGDDIVDPKDSKEKHVSFQDVESETPRGVPDVVPVDDPVADTTAAPPEVKTESSIAMDSPATPEIPVEDQATASTTRDVVSDEMTDATKMDDEEENIEEPVKAAVPETEEEATRDVVFVQSSESDVADVEEPETVDKVETKECVPEVVAVESSEGVEPDDENATGDEEIEEGDVTRSVPDVVAVEPSDDSTKSEETGEATTARSVPDVVAAEPSDASTKSEETGEATAARSVPDVVAVEPSDASTKSEETEEVARAQSVPDVVNVEPSDGTKSQECEEAGTGENLPEVAVEPSDGAKSDDEDAIAELASDEAPVIVEEQKDQEILTRSGPEVNVVESSTAVSEPSTTSTEEAFEASASATPIVPESVPEVDDGGDVEPENLEEMLAKDEPKVTRTTETPVIETEKVAAPEAMDDKPESEDGPPDAVVEVTRAVPVENVMESSAVREKKAEEGVETKEELTDVQINEAEKIEKRERARRDKEVHRMVIEARNVIFEVRDVIREVRNVVLDVRDSKKQETTSVGVSDRATLGEDSTDEGSVEESGKAPRKMMDVLDELADVIDVAEVRVDTMVVDGREKVVSTSMKESASSTTDESEMSAAASLEAIKAALLGSTKSYPEASNVTQAPRGPPPVVVMEDEADKVESPMSVKDFIERTDEIAEQAAADAAAVAKDAAELNASRQADDDVEVLDISTVPDNKEDKKEEGAEKVESADEEIDVSGPVLRELDNISSSEESDSISADLSVSSHTSDEEEEEDIFAQRPMWPGNGASSSHTSNSRTPHMFFRRMPPRTRGSFR